jgi:tRNA pseudouridine55 synthase
VSGGVPAPARRKRQINGVLRLDKPRGITSQTAVTRVKRLFAAAKAGHTGTLDPMADGLLPVCFGEATKFSHLLLDADKGYCATVKLGVTTATGDMEGEVTGIAAVRVERAAVTAVLERFTGDLLQTPPMYSAVKHAGQRLYEYARAGKTVAREPRRVRIHKIELVEFEGDELRLDVLCSKGTYIRVIAQDIGTALGCGASLAALTRTRVGDFVLADAIGLEALDQMDAGARDARLLAVDALVAGLPRVELDTDAANRIAAGRIVRREPHAGQASRLARIYGPGERFLGVAQVEPTGDIVPRRLMATPGAAKTSGIA